MKPINYVIIYFLIVSFISIVCTIIDKRNSIKNKWRISEKTLMTLGFLGGASAMLITMKIIRHKTQHKKFMLGLPIEIFLHVALIIASLYLLT